MNPPSGTITLIGSGEFGESMARVYRAIFARMPDNPRAVFLDTPAGFELNADAIASKAAEYFSQRLQIDLELASFKNKTRATALEIENALRPLRRANFILAGPGSPSYAIRNWQDTPIWQALSNRLENGAQLVFASAAAIAASACALPVYEIYKVGEDAHWLNGLNLFESLGMKLAILPHWNNAEGGTYDTRFCFMGHARFQELEQQLARDIVVLGIDEHTACTFDLATEECRVMGAGGVTIRYGDQEWIYASGETFSFARLRARAQERVLASTSLNAPSAESDETTQYLMHLARALDETRDADTKRELIEHAHDTVHELSAEWMEAAHNAPAQNSAPLIETLVEIRSQLRATKEFALADMIRQRLAALDIVLEDSSAGTTWRKA